MTTLRAATTVCPGLPGQGKADTSKQEPGLTKAPLPTGSSDRLFCHSRKQTCILIAKLGVRFGTRSRGRAAGMLAE